MAKSKKNREPIFRIPPYKVEQVYVSMSETVDWGLAMFGIPGFWKDTEGEGVKVAVLDTGWAEGHPDLSVCEARDFTGSRRGSYDVNGHGTHVAGTIGARRNSQGVVGVAPKVDLYIGKVLGDNGSGSSRGIAKGIHWAIDEKCDGISMSLGAPRPSRIIHEAIIDAVAAGLFVIVAAGNAGPRLGTVGFPGGHPETLTVGSISQNRKVSGFSSRGKQVDIVAPGDQILSCYPPRSYAKLSGTSMATPFVTGVVCLMLAKHRFEGGSTPIKNQKDIIEHLRKTAIDAGPQGFDPSYGYGLINPASLLKAPDPPPDAIEGEKVVIGGKEYVVTSQLVLTPAA